MAREELVPVGLSAYVGFTVYVNYCNSCGDEIPVITRTIYMKGVIV